MFPHFWKKDSLTFFSLSLSPGGGNEADARDGWEGRFEAHIVGIEKTKKDFGVGVGRWGS